MVVGRIRDSKEATFGYKAQTSEFLLVDKYDHHASVMQNSSCGAALNRNGRSLNNGNLTSG